MKKYYTRVCNFYYGNHSKRLNKNVYPSNKEDIKVDNEEEGSALGSIGLKPKIVH